MVVRRRRALKIVWWRLFERDLVRHAAAVHVFFGSERPHVEALGYGGPLLAAPNGVEVPVDLKWDGGTGRYVLWLGRFDPEHKGLDLLLRALRALPQGRRPILRLHGPDRRGQKQNMKRLASALGLEDSVVIGPPIYGWDKWQMLSRAAAFVYPSRWEAFGNATAEAVALGVPTLVTPYPLGRYLALRGGAVLAEATPEAVACGLEQVLSASAAETARIGAEVMRREFGWQDVSRSWLRQLEELA
jgi:glycosyltransferase involved in cell wall biosynthesis